MIEYACLIAPAQRDRIEAVLSEAICLHWSIHENRLDGSVQLKGYFDSEAGAAAAWEELCAACPALPGTPEIRRLDDRDWREAYRDFFQPWSLPGLHWVPEWMRETHPVPRGDAVLYLDPGMAFGTGNHETTRLCARRLLEARERWGDAVQAKTVLDAGCGSGILALSAAALGFGSVEGFDNDPAAVRIARENAERNGLSGVRFHRADLAAGLRPDSADILLANILEDVLRRHSKSLLLAVRPGGVLVLSGVLREQAAGMDAAFSRTAARLGRPWLADSREEGEWVDLVWTAPLLPPEPSAE